MIFATRKIMLQPNKSLLIVPFGEIQTEAEYERLVALVKWLGKHKKRGGQVLMLGMGDYFESPSPSDRAALRAAKQGSGMYEELAKDIMAIYEARTRNIADILAPLSGDIAGLLRGHHWLEFLPSIRADLPADTNRLLALLLKTLYLGSSVQLIVEVNGLPFKIFATHGYGSARTAGARVAKRLRMRDVVLDANWYIMGHDNEKMVYPTEALVGREYKKQYFSGSGSFQRSYNLDEAEGTYAEDLLLPPTTLGVVICTVKPQKDTVGETRLDFHVST